MSDMSTFAGQAEHYAGIKAKFASVREPKPVERVRHVALRLKGYEDIQNPPLSAPPVPVITTPPEVTAERLRDMMFLASPEFFIDRTNWLNIGNEVSAKHRVTLLEIKSPRRSAYIVLARHELFYRLAHETTLSLPDIGRRLGGKDHTTVLHGMRRHAQRNNLPMRERPRLAA